jgi:hypothetical protein
MTTIAPSPQSIADLAWCRSLTGSDDAQHIALLQHRINVPTADSNFNLKYRTQLLPAATRILARFQQVRTRPRTRFASSKSP